MCIAEYLPSRSVTRLSHYFHSLPPQLAASNSDSVQCVAAKSKRIEQTDLTSLEAFRGDGAPFQRFLPLTDPLLPSERLLSLSLAATHAPRSDAKLFLALVSPARTQTRALPLDLGPVAAAAAATGGGYKYEAAVSYDKLAQWLSSATYPSTTNVNMNNQVSLAGCWWELWYRHSDGGYLHLSTDANNASEESNSTATLRASVPVSASAGANADAVDVCDVVVTLTRGFAAPTQDDLTVLRNAHNAHSTNAGTDSVGTVASIDDTNAVTNATTACVSTADAYVNTVVEAAIAATATDSSCPAVAESSDNCKLNQRGDDRARARAALVAAPSTCPTDSLTWLVASAPLPLRGSAGGPAVDASVPGVTDGASVYRASRLALAMTSVFAHHYEYDVCCNSLCGDPQCGALLTCARLPLASVPISQTASCEVGTYGAAIDRVDNPFYDEDLVLGRSRELTPSYYRLDHCDCTVEMCASALSEHFDHEKRRNCPPLAHSRAHLRSANESTNTSVSSDSTQVGRNESASTGGSAGYIIEKWEDTTARRAALAISKDRDSCSGDICYGTKNNAHFYAAAKEQRECHGRGSTNGNISGLTYFPCIAVPISAPRAPLPLLRWPVLNGCAHKRLVYPHSQRALEFDAVNALRFLAQTRVNNPGQQSQPREHDSEAMHASKPSLLLQFAQIRQHHALLRALRVAAATPPFRAGAFSQLAVTAEAADTDACRAMFQLSERLNQRAMEQHKSLQPGDGAVNSQSATLQRKAAAAGVTAAALASAGAVMAEKPYVMSEHAHVARLPLYRLLVEAGRARKSATVNDRTCAAAAVSDRDHSQQRSFVVVPAAAMLQIAAYIPVTETVTLTGYASGNRYHNQATSRRLLAVTDPFLRGERPLEVTVSAHWNDRGWGSHKLALILVLRSPDPETGDKRVNVLRHNNRNMLQKTSPTFDVDDLFGKDVDYTGKSYVNNGDLYSSIGFPLSLHIRTITLLHQLSTVFSQLNTS